MKIDSSSIRRLRSSWLLMVVGIMALVALPASPMQLDKPCRPVPGCQCEPEGSNMCLSKSCVNTASEILSSMDETQDPCEDFYQFACGNWAKINPIPEGMSGFTVLNKLAMRNVQVIRTALEKVNVTDEHGAESKAKLFYDSCIDKSGIKEKLGAKPLLDLIKDVGGWHLLDKTINKDTEELELQVLLQNITKKYNVRALMTWSVQPERRNDSENVIVLEAALSLPRDNFVNKTSNKKVLDAYLNYTTKFCVLLGANETQAREEMSRVLQFETELTDIPDARENKTNDSSLNQEFTIKQWQKKANFLNWTLFFNDVLSLVEKTITENDIIIVNDARYFLKLGEVLSKYTKSEENKKTLKSFVILQTFPLTKYLSKQFRDLTEAITEVLFDDKGYRETWQSCVKETANVFGFAVGAMFVREVFNAETKTESELLLKNIRNTFRNHLKKLDWMDPETKKAAEAKANAVGEILGYPDHILRKKDLDKQYEELVVKPDTYFQSVLNHKTYTLKHNLRYLGQPVNRTEWYRPSVVNAYFYPWSNLVVIPAGILQPPVFARDRPAVANYAGGGAIMGHELVHRFKYHGKYYRFLDRNHPWNNATLKKIKERAACIREQYSNYSIDGIPLNGDKTLNEDIADNGGLKASFHAYLDHSRTEARVNLTLPGLKYNHRQLFFISFAQVWCSAETKFNRKKIERDTHSVPKYRVIGSLSNLREFSEEFQCPVGSKMNPKNKCELW